MSIRRSFGPSVSCTFGKRRRALSLIDRATFLSGILNHRMNSSNGLKNISTIRRSVCPGTTAKSLSEIFYFRSDVGRQSGWWWCDVHRSNASSMAHSDRVNRIFARGTHLSSSDLDGTTPSFPVYRFLLRKRSRRDCTLMVPIKVMATRTIPGMCRGK